MLRKAFIPFLVLALVSMACGIQINLPITEVKTGPTQVEQISIPLPENQSEVTNLSLSFGAGDIHLSPNAEGALITGTVTYNVPDFKPTVTQIGNSVTIEQGNLNINGIPTFKNNLKNSWDFRLGGRPMNLKLTAGAYNGVYELGGLALKALQISDGASDAQLSFSKPNLITMDSFSYGTGASTVTLKGLANAHFKTMTFKGGAGTYVLDYSGALAQDASVTVDAGISTVTIIVPEGTSARVTFEGGVSTVNPAGAWQRSGAAYVLPGTGPKLEILVKLGAGTLNLSNQ